MGDLPMGFGEIAVARIMRRTRPQKSNAVRMPAH